MGLVSVQLAVARLAQAPAGIVVTDEQLMTMATDAAVSASDVLYERSGRVFAGLCGPYTIRPVSRPSERDERLTGAGFGFNGSWGSLSYFGLAVPSVLPHYGPSEPPEIKFASVPVREILEVKIDGVVIPPDEYELRNHNTLVRMRPTVSTQPTQRWGWPTSQINDLPDTESGTFSITFTFGQSIPPMGLRAARKLGEFFLLPELGDTSRFPQRITSMNRQGVAVTVQDVIDVIAKGSLGIYEVDVFLSTVNPCGNQRQAEVYSPDVGRERRQAFPSRS